jgi:hypothetical protein
MPVWPYDLGDNFAHLRQAYGQSPFWWFWPTRADNHSSGCTFPISDEWFRLNLLGDERSKYVYRLSASEVLERLEHQATPSVLAILLETEGTNDSVEINM